MKVGERRGSTSTSTEYALRINASLIFGQGCSKGSINWGQ